MTDLLEVAVSLRNLLQQGDLRRDEFHRIYEDPVTQALPPGGLPSPDTQRKHVERALPLLAEWGFPTDYQDGVLSLLDPGPPAESRCLDLDAGQHDLLAAVRESLEEIDPHRLPPISSYALLVKEYRFADLELTLSDGRTLVGTNYFTHLGTTATHLHVRTETGDVAVPAEGITRLAVLRRRTIIDFQGSSDPELVDVPDAGALRFDLRQGRPSNLVELLHAQAVIADLEVRLPRSREDEPSISFDEIAALSGQSVEFVRGNATRICRLDRSLSPEGDGLVRIALIDERPQPLSGAAALVALHDVVTFAGLGAGRRLLTAGADLAEIDELRIQLEAFLTLASVDVDPPEAPCAERVVAALVGQGELSVVTPLGQRLLRPTGLHWHGGHWWLLGTCDGRRLLDGELALDAIVDAG